MNRAVSILIAFATMSAACTPSQLGMKRMATALAETSSAYSTDDDPEFVRLAAPSTLKMMEMLLVEQPSNEQLLATACSGFTQYAFGFLQMDAESIETPDGEIARELRARAGRMYERARGYCLRALEIRHPGIEKSLAADALRALAVMTKTDVPMLYWTGLSYAGSVSMAENQLQRVGDLATARALLSRALALDEGWEGGALHEAFITLDGLPRLLGGSAERARQHFDRAVQLSGGQSAFAYVSMAASVALPAKNRAEFERLLRAALAIDLRSTPRLRLANAIAQRRARVLLSQANRLF
jgi:predicted anti-sigma-YlaC factor YlaD